MTREPLPPVDPRATPFAVLGYEAPRFGVEERDLERAWLDRARRVHPDRFAARPDAERRAAAEHTVALNEAYRRLRDPYDRAVWLVRAAGVPDSTLDSGLLVELMELRERAEDDAGEREAVVTEARARFDALAHSVRERLLQVDAVPSGYAAPSEALKQVAHKLAAMKTWARLVDDLGGGKLISTLDGR